MTTTVRDRKDEIDLTREHLECFGRRGRLVTRQKPRLILRSRLTLSRCLRRSRTLSGLIRCRRRQRGGRRLRMQTAKRSKHKAQSRDRHRATQRDEPVGDRHSPHLINETAQGHSRGASQVPPNGGFLALAAGRVPIGSNGVVADIPNIPGSLTERGGAALEWERLRERLAAGARSELGRIRVLALEPSADPSWIGQQQQRTAEMRRLVALGAAFDFRGLLDPDQLLDEARIEGAALEPAELLALLVHAERVDAWRRLVMAPPDDLKNNWPAVDTLSAPLIEHDLGNLLRTFRGKIEPDGSLADDASPELARIRRALARQHRIIEESLRKTLAQLSEGGETQGDLITVRGERFVIPVKAEFKRKVRGILHGSSSSGQTVYLEPMETVEQNNELARLLDDEQAEIHRILVAMTRAVALNAIPLTLGAEILSELDAHQSVAVFAQELECAQPIFINASEANAQDIEETNTANTEFEIVAARHPLLELRMRAEAGRIVPMTVALPEGQRQM